MDKPDIRSEIKGLALEAGLDVEHAESLAQKCYDDFYWRPYGGATSFAEIDKSEAAREYTYKVDEETYKLRSIIENITRVDELDITQKVSAIQVATGEYGSRVSALSPTEQKGLFDKIKRLFKSKDYYEDDEEDEEEDEDEKKGKKALTVSPPTSGVGIKVFTDSTGAKRWVATSSNAFEDLEKELFTTKALEEAVEHSDKTGERGPLLIFHVPGAKVGQCDVQAISGRFLIESGTFDDTPLGRKAVEHFEQNPDEAYQVSIGFEYIVGDEQDGQYDWLRIKERSICPFGTAANPWTDFKMLGEGDMDSRHREALEKFLGKELTEGIIATSERATKALEENGIRYKEVKEEEKPTEETTTASSGVTATVAVPVEATPEPPKEEEKSLGAKEVEAIGAAISAALEPMTKAIETLSQNLATVQSEVKELQMSDDEKIAAKITPRATPVQSNRPSEGNEISEDKVKEIIGEVINGGVDINPAKEYVDDLRRANGVRVS